jgi:prepilin-type N-terminal cleavage/methylation domain-containing protein
VNKRSRPSSARRGFTVLEVLVVLGIMVVLFALLFVPMTSSLTLVSSGRAQSEMQQSLRQAQAQVQQDLSEAMYVFPPEQIKQPGTGAYLVNYSTITFIPPARDAVTGAILKPLHPQLDANGNVIAVRYAVHTPNTVIQHWAQGTSATPFPAHDKYLTLSQLPGPETTFALYRQQGQCLWDPDLGSYTFGSALTSAGKDTTNATVAAGTFVIDQPVVENAMTAHIAVDIPVTRTVCRDNGQWAAGWVSVNPSDPTTQPNGDATWTNNVVYLFDSIQFRPDRVEQEQLQPTPDATVYWATKANWLGVVNDGSQTVGDLLWPLPYPATAGQLINSSETRPRIVVRRWNSTATPPGFTNVILDTDTLSPSVAPPTPSVDNLLGLAPPPGGSNYTLGLRWNSKAGCVLPAGYLPPSVIDFSAALGTDPGAGYWPLVTDASVVPEPMNPSATPPAYPPLAASRAAGSPRVPTSYVLDPYQLESPQYQAGSPTPANVRDIKIMTDTLRVWIVATYPNGQVVRTEYSPSTDSDPSQLGPTQYYVEAIDNGLRARLLFNPYTPPSPDNFVPTWTLGTGYGAGALVRDPATGQLYSASVANVASALTEPGMGQNWSSTWTAAGSLTSVLSGFQVQIQYLARRNFDPISGIDDQIVASYSTGYDYDVKLGLAEFNVYQAVVATPAQTAILAPYKVGAQVVLSAHMPVGNAGR